MTWGYSSHFYLYNMQDFIDAFNSFLKKERKELGIQCMDFVVEHIQVLPDDKFKVYKHLTYTFKIINNRDNPTLFEYTKIFNTTSSKIEEVYKEIHNKAMIDFFNLIKSDNILNIIEGKQLNGNR